MGYVVFIHLCRWQLSSSLAPWWSRIIYKFLVLAINLMLELGVLESNMQNNPGCTAPLAYLYIHQQTATQVTPTPLHSACRLCYMYIKMPR